MKVLDGFISTGTSTLGHLYSRGTSIQGTKFGLGKRPHNLCIYSLY